MKKKYEYSLAALVAAMLLASCGGGDDSSAAGAPLQTQRISRETFDHDGNGTVDATLRYFYGTDGRIASRQLTYTGDTATDLVSFQGSVSRNESFTYDAQGHVSAYDSSSINGSNAFKLQYGGDGTLTRFDVEQKDGSGAVLTKQYMLYTYSGGRLSQIDVYAPDGTPKLRQQISYGSDGWPSSSIALNPSTSALLSRSEFTWTADGKILSMKADTNGDGVIEETDTFTYVGGKLSKGTRATGGLFTGTPTAIYSYAYDGSGRMERMETDLQSNGSIEGRGTIEYETGPCRPVTYYLTLPISTSTGRDSSPTGELNFCAP